MGFWETMAAPGLTITTEEKFEFTEDNLVEYKNEIKRLEKEKKKLIEQIEIKKIKTIDSKCKLLE